MPDAVRRRRALRHDLAGLDARPELTRERLRAVYREACLCRAHVERVVQECQKGTVKFALWGPGEEIHGTAAALAFEDSVDPASFAIAGHYRSGALVAMWTRLRGYGEFHLDMMRQQLSRSTDPWSGGRNMAAHFNDLRHGVLPVQSSLGMQVSKSVGYAQGLRRRGIEDGVVACVVGDGTCAEGDLHEGMTAASILQLPWLLMITDNEIAISVTPEDGRGIRDFAAYARAFGFEYFCCDGNDFVENYEVVRAAAQYCRLRQRPALLWVRGLSRLNDHSSAADFAFKFDQHDPLLDFGAALVQRGVLAPEEAVTRRDGGDKDFFRRHDLGSFLEEADRHVQETMRIAASEPDPDLDSAFEHIFAPFPSVREAPPQGRPTCVSLNGAIRAALRDILDENPMSWLYGQDVGKKGGVMQATRGLIDRFPSQVRDAPINEPLILGTATGFAMHPGATALPEIQFSDYSLNTFHWLVYLGNLLWSTAGTVRANVVVRLPVEPLHGGAVYHSMCMEGFYGSIPGLVICAPTTSRDCYGLLRSAADYDGPVLMFESKGLYRMALGDAFPGEPTDRDEIAALKRAIGFQGHIPDLDPTLRVPFGRAAVRRTGTDLTIATWGRCTLFAASAAEELQAQGISVEILDMRTLAPLDIDAVVSSVGRTGRLLVVHEDRVFASIGREIQGAVQERFLGRGVPIRVLGQAAIPGIPQNIHLEERLVVSPAKIVAAARELARINPAQSPGVVFVPNRRFVA